ncbi:MAG: hypothetical protein PSX36_10250 [bacterium]|nr:hypothetical protein [bacterium]
MIKITSIQQLKNLAYKENGDFVEFYIFLADGLARSCKRISYRPSEAKQWLIINEIDATYQELLERNLSRKTIIVEAINKEAFFCV